MPLQSVRRAMRGRRAARRLVSWRATARKAGKWREGLARVSARSVPVEWNVLARPGGAGPVESEALGARLDGTAPRSDLPGADLGAGWVYRLHPFTGRGRGP